MALRLRIESRRPPPLRRLFSSSANEYNDSGKDKDKDKDKDRDRDPQSSPIASHFRDVTAALKHQPSGDQPLLRAPSQPSFLSRPQQQSSSEALTQLRKRLSEFRAVLPQPSSGPSFSKAYQQSGGAEPTRNAGKFYLEGVKESLKGIVNNGNAIGLGSGGLGSSGSGDRMSLSRFTNSLGREALEGDKGAPRASFDGVGREDGLPLSIFGKEIRDLKEDKGGKQLQNLDMIRFTKSYAYDELGEKLRMLRSTAGDGGTKGFSLEELNERLVRLKKMEEEEEESKSRTGSFGWLRKTLQSSKQSDEEKAKRNTCKWVYYQDVLCPGLDLGIFVCVCAIMPRTPPFRVVAVDEENMFLGFIL